MNEPSVRHVACDSPTQLNDLFFAVVLKQLVKKALVHVRVVHENPLGVVESGLLRLGEALLTPRADLVDGLLFEGVSFP